MSETKPIPGQIGWIDLTVPDAEPIRDFYQSVVGWQAEPHAMGDYNDYSMLPPGANVPVAGICHQLGVNERIPSQWLIYIVVADIGASSQAAADGGGEIIVPVRQLGSQGAFCVIRDPAGAVCALWQSTDS